MKKNFVYSILYELVVAFYPLLMLPYVSHVLGKDGVGIYSYTYAILGFFLLGCQLGVNLCGTRAIAQTRDDINLMTRRFKSIFAIQLSFSCIVIITYLAYVDLYSKEYKLYFYLLLPFLFGQAIRVSWFYLGLGEIKTIFVRNIVIRLISVIGILLFVRTEDDLKLYFAVMSISYLAGDISVWPNVIKHLSNEPFSFSDAKVYIFPMIKMFIPLLALKGAYYIDEIMLGAMHAIGSVAIYENTYKILNVLLQFYTVIANILTAHASNLVANDRIEKNIQYVISTIDLSSALMIPILVGLMAIAPEFIPWYMGEQFAECVELTQFLPIVLLFSGTTNILRTQYFIPMEKDNKYILTVLLGVLVNVSLNSLLIPTLGYMGAATGAIVSELVITVVSVCVVNREYGIREAFRFYYLYFIGAFLMWILVRAIGIIMGVGASTNAVQVCLGGIFYIFVVLGTQKIIFKSDKKTIYYYVVIFLQSQKFRKE